MLILPIIGSSGLIKLKNKSSGLKRFARILGLAKQEKELI